MFHPTTPKEGTGCWINETQVCMMRSETALYVSLLLCEAGCHLMGTGPTKSQEGDQGTKVRIRPIHLYLCCHKYVPQVQPDCGGFYRISLPSRFFNEANNQTHHHLTRHPGYRSKYQCNFLLPFTGSFWPMIEWFKLNFSTHLAST